MVLNSGVSFAALLASAAQCHALVERHPVANNRRFANHNAHAVVDAKAMPNLRTRVYLDASEKARILRNQAWKKWHPALIEVVGDAMQKDGVQALVEQHFGQVAGRGVIDKD
jgi:hypothetical protein